MEKEHIYKLELTEKQARALSYACDQFSRLICGQDWSYQELMEAAWEKRSKEATGEMMSKEFEGGWDKMRDTAESLSKQMKKIFWGLPSNALNGIHYDDTADILFDIYQVIRHQLWLDRPDDKKSRMTVDSDPAMQYGTEPLAKIQRIDNKKQVNMENYEQKYKEAIKRAKRCYEGNSIYVFPKMDLEYIFPELVESEDERNRRIKKEVIEMLHYYHSKSPCFIPPQFSLEETLAWLEKQGEQKPTWSEEDEGMFDSIIEDVMPYGECHYYPTDEEIEYFYEGGRKVEWLKSLKERIKK